MTITLRFLIEILYLLAASSIKISILSVATTFFTPEIKSIILATNVLKSGKNKKEVKNDLLSMMAPEGNFFEYRSSIVFVTINILY